MLSCQPILPSVRVMVGMLCAFLAAIMVFSGLVTHFWTVQQSGGRRLLHGLWTTCKCWDIEFLAIYSTGWLSWSRGFEITGTVATFLSAVTAVCAFFLGHHSKAMAAFMVILSWIAFVSILVGIFLYLNKEGSMMHGGSFVATVGALMMTVAAVILFSVTLIVQ